MLWPLKITRTTKNTMTTKYTMTTRFTMRTQNTVTTKKYHDHTKISMSLNTHDH